MKNHLWFALFAFILLSSIIANGQMYTYHDAWFDANGNVVADNATYGSGGYGKSSFAYAHIQMPSGAANSNTASGSSYAEAVTQKPSFGEGGQGFFSGYNEVSDICWDTSDYSDFSEPVNIPTISGAQSINDGSSAPFAINSQGTSISSVSWSFSAPGGAGNNPNVAFSPSSRLNTTTDGHWFANPNDACTASTSSTYTIKATVHFSSGSVYPVSSLIVNVPWDPAGKVDPSVTTISGSPDDDSLADNLWHVTGYGTLARVVPTAATFYVPSNSQFYNKTVQHEQVHLNNWLLGPGHLFGDLYVVDDFYKAIKDLTGDTELDLLLKIRDAKILYLDDQKQKFQQRLAEDERQAYTVSDGIAPQYLYQRSCPGHTI